MSKDNTAGQASDESIRAYLKESLEHLLAAGHSAHEMVEFSIDKFGRRIIPQLKELQEDIHERRVEIQNLAESAKAAVFGIQATPEQREQLVREAAYLHAERRNFSGDDQEADWLSAERDVDDLLSRQDGLLESARKNIESVSEITKRELAEAKSAVRQWFKSRGAEKKVG